MTLPALAAVAGLAIAAHLGRRGSASKLSEKNKKRIVELLQPGLVSEARALAVELGFDTLDLSGAYLSFANLSDADLSNTNLSNANLFRASLIGADLTDANLSSADLYGANLRRANLSNADLRSTNLSFATLTGANLTNTTLTGADLTGATLTGADLTGADLTGANLDRAFILNATGINTGPARTFIGIPHGYIETRSPFVPGRTNLRRIE